MDDLENRERRNNLVFYGLAEHITKETAAQSEELIISQCNAKLEVSSLTIERAHRLGKFCEGKNRPIIVRFNSFKDRQAVLGKAFTLRGSNVAISEDFSRTVRDSERNYGRMINKTAKEA